MGHKPEPEQPRRVQALELVLGLGAPRSQHEAEDGERLSQHAGHVGVGKGGEGRGVRGKPFEEGAALPFPRLRRQDQLHRAHLDGFTSRGFHDGRGGLGRELEVRNGVRWPGSGVSDLSKGVKGTPPIAVVGYASCSPPDPFSVHFWSARPESGMMSLMSH